MQGLHGLQDGVCEGGGWEASLGGKEDLQLPHKRHRCRIILLLLSLMYQMLEYLNALFFNVSDLGPKF